MSFGGGSTQYILEYIIKVTNQGGSGAITPIRSSIDQVTNSTKQLTASQQQLATAHERVIQAGQGVSKAAKGMAFGLIGITTAGAEAIGMFSMWQQTQEAVTNAQGDVNRALKESGKNSKDYKDATNELVKAQRWQRMTQRNLMLSFFDLVPFIVLTINGILKLKTALKAMAEAKAAEAALKSLGTTSNAVTTAENALGGSTITLSKNVGTMGKTVATSVTPLANITKNVKGMNTAVVGTKGPLAGIISQASAAGTNFTIMGNNAATAETGVKKLSTAMRVLQTALKIAIPLVILEIGSQAFVNNWGGFADRLNEVGVAAGKAIPQLQGVFDMIGKIGKTIAFGMTGEWDKIGEIWSNGMKNAGQEMSKKEQQAIEEAEKQLQDFRDNARQLLSDIAGSEGKERKGFLIDLGIKNKGKGIEKDFKGFLKMIEKMDKETKQAVSKIQALDRINIIQELANKYGFDPKISSKTIAKMRSTLGSDLEDLIKGPNDIFNKFGQVIKQHAKDSQPQFNAAILEFVNDHPGLLADLAKLEPELATAIQNMVQNAKDQAAANMTADQKADKLWDAAFAAPEVNNKFVNGVLVETEADTKAKEDAKRRGIAMANGFKEGIQSVVGGKNSVLGQAAGGFDWMSLLGPRDNPDVLTEQEAGQWFDRYILTPLLGAWNTFVPAAVAILKMTPLFANADFNVDILAPRNNPDVLTPEEVGQWLDANLLTPITGAWNTFKPYVVGYLKTTPLFAGADFNVDILAPRNNPQVLTPKDVEDWFTRFVVTPIQGAWNTTKTYIVGYLKTTPLFAGADFNVDILAPRNNPQVLTLKDAADWFTRYVITPLEGAWNTITQDWNTFVTDPASTIMAALGSASQIATKMMGTIDDITKPVRSWFDTYIWNPLNKAWKDFTADVNTFFSNPANSIGSALGSAGEFLKKIMGLQIANAETGPSQVININLDLGGDILKMPEKVKKAAADILDTFNTAFQAIGKAIGVLASGWSEAMNSFGSNAKSGGSQVLDAFNTAFQAIGEAIGVLASGWSEAMNSFGSNAQSGGNQVRKALFKAFSAVDSNIRKLAHNWSVAMNSMGANARSAAKQVKSALNSIPTDLTTTIHVQKVFEFAHGGLMSLAKGGVISAAQGRLLTTNGPTYLVGDNPGGRESIWAIPHNNPGKTVNDINRIYGTSGRSGSNSTLNETIVMHISGSNIINETKLTKKVKFTMGENMDVFG